MQLKSSKPLHFSLFASFKMKMLTLVLVFLIVGIFYTDLSVSFEKVSISRINSMAFFIYFDTFKSVLEISFCFTSQPSILTFLINFRKLIFQTMKILLCPSCQLNENNMQQNARKLTGVLSTLYFFGKVDTKQIENIPILPILLECFSTCVSCLQALNQRLLLKKSHRG